MSKSRRRKSRRHSKKKYYEGDAIDKLYKKSRSRRRSRRHHHRSILDKLDDYSSSSYYPSRGFYPSRGNYPYSSSRVVYGYPNSSMFNSLGLSKKWSLEAPGAYKDNPAQMAEYLRNVLATNPNSPLKFNI